MEASILQQIALIDALRHTLEQPVELIETHISWVLLAGEHAYKIKKAVDLGFLDFTTLEKRRFYCEEELRLNRRLAPDLYLEVTPITGSIENPLLDGPGKAIEYAVKMRRFPQSCLLDQVLQRGGLAAETVDAIAAKIADFHSRIEIAGASSQFGAPDRVCQPVRGNFAQIRSRLDQPDSKLDELEQWSEREYQEHLAAFAARKAQGSIRECHGDLHLGNIVLLEGEAVPFDCIEFNPDLRWIDVISETAFLSMDLRDRGRPDLARRFLNAYLGQTGDYAGLEVLRYYMVYRAMVRAKVACIRAGQEAGEERNHLWAQYRRHVELAEGFTRRSPPFLAINHGLSGSGKTTVTQGLLETLDVFRVRSDVERKRLYGLRPEARSAAGVGEGMYSAEATARTYRRLYELARAIVLSGYPVVVDATFLRRRERADFRELAQELGVPFFIVDFTAPEHLLRERVEQRRQQRRDASEADIAVLESQLCNQEPLDETELSAVIEVDTRQAVDAQALAQRLEEVICRR